MQKRDGFAKGLAVVGTVAVWLPIVATVVTTRYDPQAGGLRFDWLMPAELFPAALVGALLLMWAAVRAHDRVSPIAWGLGVVVAGLAAVFVIPAVTGLASGTTSPEAAPLAVDIVTVCIAAYAAALVEMGIEGILVIRDLFKRGPGDATHSARGTAAHAV